MTDFMQRTLDSAAERAPAWLQDFLRDGRGRWEASDLPTRKTENWKYTNIHALRQSFAPPEASSMALADVAVELPDLGGCRLVFVNGHYRPELSRAGLPDGVSLVRFADAGADQASRIREHLGTAAGRDRALFTALNDAALADGVFLEIDAEAKVEEPLHIAWVTGNQDSAFSVNQRLLVLCGEHSRARVVEHFASARGQQETFTNGITELEQNN